MRATVCQGIAERRATLAVAGDMHRSGNIQGPRRRPTHLSGCPVLLLLAPRRQMWDAGAQMRDAVAAALPDVLVRKRKRCQLHIQVGGALGGASLVYESNLYVF